MRMRTTVKIDGVEYVIKELTVEEIIGLLSDDQSKEMENKTPATIEENLFGFGPLLDRIISLAFESHIKRVDLMKLAPSEIKILVDGFKEVNSNFLATARLLKMDEIILKIVGRLSNAFSISAADSSKPVI